MAEVILLGFGSQSDNLFEGEGTAKGDFSQLRTLLTVNNVLGIDVNDAQDYEENIAGEFVFHLNNGDTVRIIGYHAMWEIETYNGMTDSAKEKFLNDFLGWVEYQIKWELSDLTIIE